MSTSVRTTNGLVETESLTLQHRLTGHTVELIGVLHVADPSFWRLINSHMRKRTAEGYVIHYELINGTSFTKDRGGKMMLHMTAAMKTLVAKAKEAGLMYQTEGISYPEGAVNTDMSKDEVRQAFAKVPSWFPLQMRLARTLFGLFPAADFKRILGEMLAKSGSASLASGGVNSALILDARNAIASQYALTSTRPVVAIWGAAHLAGISANLQAAGYRVISRDWLPVYSYPFCNQHG